MEMANKYFASFAIFVPLRDLFSKDDLKIDFRDTYCVLVKNLFQ